MFERFAPGARTVVELAVAEAGELHHPYVGTEHLLLGLLGEAGIAARALGEAGVSAAAVRADVQRRVAGAGLSKADADALRAIGIDVDHIRARVEAAFGPGALERARLGNRRGGDRHGHTPLSPRAKAVLALSLREALRLGHRHIGPEHILLGLLTEGNGLAAQVLAGSGVDARDLRRTVLDAMATAA